MYIDHVLNELRPHVRAGQSVWWVDSVGRLRHGQAVRCWITTDGVRRVEVRDPETGLSANPSIERVATATNEPWTLAEHLAREA